MERTIKQNKPKKMWVYDSDGNPLYEMTISQEPPEELTPEGKKFFDGFFQSVKTGKPFNGVAGIHD